MHRHFYMMKRSRKLISANKGETIMSNTVITIARQYGSGGRTVGKMLAKRLDIPCYDREIISLASEESGIHPTLFQDEKKKHGSLRAFLTGGFKNASPLSPESAGFTKDDNLFRYQAKIIRQLAEESSCVIIGRCADHILADVPGVVRVFVHAPEDFCLQEAMKVNSLSVRSSSLRPTNTVPTTTSITPARNGKTPRITTCLWTAPVSALMAQ